ncbi:MAG: hypothetical protein ACTSR3_15930, partial [Candidatus Helarchaeota archaeon]
INNRKICNIDEKHPDFQILNQELNDILVNEKQLKNAIKKDIENIYSRIEFTLSLKNDEILEINVYNNQISEIGVIYHFYQKYNNQIHPFLVENNWFYQNKININFSDQSISCWIGFIEEIKKKIDKDYSSLFQKDRKAFIAKLESIKAESGRSSNFELSIDEFKTILKEICKVEENDWYHLIYAKLLEGEVFE